MKESLSFAAGFSQEIRSRGEGKTTFKVMDFTKAKEVIKNYCEDDNGITASMGLQEDWACTSGCVFKDGKFQQVHDCAYLGSLWATPLLCIEKSDGSVRDLVMYTEVGRDDVQEDLSKCPDWWTGEHA